MRHSGMNHTVRERFVRAVAAKTLVGALAVALAAGSALLPATAHAAGLQSVPEGNRNASQPDIPFASARRTSAFKSSYDRKFEKVLGVLRRDQRLLSSIKKVAKLYRIDPVHMIGAIVGEHTYNYDTLDSAQGYYIKAAAYAGLDISFQYGKEPVEDFVERKQFERCHSARMQRNSNVKWSCYERVWNNSFRGRMVDGISYPNQTFNQTFFQPLFAGQSFGLGQLTPLTILKMSDRVHEVSGFPKLKPADALAIYQAAMDPDKSLHYMAAVIQDAIEAYKDVAKVDISANPGITATLYNVGAPWERAMRYNRARQQGKARWPEENYYGWLVNDRLDDLRALL
ncbi:DUF1402 family protein [Breoghania sp. JC706]|uniref:DUF1402 family protein n=1 Tax=Breoghania sp. JC706 TaxID=3117732 RepID=UPI00300A7FFC